MVYVNCTQPSRRRSLTLPILPWHRHVPPHAIPTCPPRRSLTLTLPISQEAMEGTDYQQLHAAIIKARQSGCDATDIDSANAVLKTLTPETLDKDELKELMDWSKVTVNRDTAPVISRCESPTATYH